jgi:hypothetical protein
MASSAPSKLTAFQREVLDAFFQRERGFFLTGGAALAASRGSCRRSRSPMASSCRPVFRRRSYGPTSAS